MMIHKSLTHIIVVASILTAVYWVMWLCNYAHYIHYWYRGLRLKDSNKLNGIGPQQKTAQSRHCAYFIDCTVFVGNQLQYKQ